MLVPFPPILEPPLTLNFPPYANCQLDLSFGEIIQISLPNPLFEGQVQKNLLDYSVAIPLRIHSIINRGCPDEQFTFEVPKSLILTLGVSVMKITCFGKCGKCESTPPESISQ